MYKKIVALLLSGVMCVGMLTGCGDSSKSSTTSKPAASQPATSEPTKAPEAAGIKYSISDKVLKDYYPEIPTDGVEITDEMCESSLVCKGNWQRLARVMDKASKGEEITIAYIGGSITDGSLASPQAEKCYAGLTQTWWQYTFPECKINYVNAGVGATDSYIGVHRLEKDVLSHKPDLIVVEFSVNDTTAINKETYESLLRKALSAEGDPAVISLVLCTETSFYQDHYNLAYKLEVPCISYAKVAQDNMSKGIWKWEQLGAPDKVHPNNGGHSVIAHLLAYFYNKVLLSIPETSFTEYTVPEDKVTLDRYENANILYSSDIVATEAQDFEAAEVRSNLFNKNGWKTTEGGSITFEVKDATNLGIIFWGTTDGKSGQFDVYVNDELATTINADFTGQWGSYASYAEVGKFPNNDGLKITIKPSANSKGDVFTILALAIS